ncbi:MAG: hypothetical protein V1872_01505 [bacterium]
MGNQILIYEGILREFYKQEIKYVLVGGIAFNLLGGFRNTLDLDIIVEMRSENLLKIVQIMLDQGYKVKQPVNPKDIAIDAIRNSWIKEKNMKAFNFYKDERSFEEVNIIIESPINFEEAIKNLVFVKIGDISLPVISVDNLIKMKEFADRDKDRLDIKELLKIKVLRDECQ